MDSENIDNSISLLKRLAVQNETLKLEDLKESCRILAKDLSESNAVSLREYLQRLFFIEDVILPFYIKLFAKTFRMSRVDDQQSDFVQPDRLTNATDMELLLSLIEITRLLRNISPGNSENQAAIVKSSFPDCFLQVFSQANKVSCGGQDWKECVFKFFKLSFQTLCNAVVCNSQCASLILKDSYMHRLLKAATKLEDIVLLQNCTMLLNYCLNNKNEVDIMLRNEEFECKLEASMLEVLLEVVKLYSNGNFFGISPIRNSDDPITESGIGELYEIISWIIGKIVDTADRQKLMSLRFFDASSELSVCFLSVWLYHISHDKWECPGVEPMIAVKAHFRKLLEKSDENARDAEALLLVKILGVYSSYDEVYRDQVDQTDLIRDVLSELRTGSKIFGYKTGLVRIIANVSMCRRINQDYVRNVYDGLLLILNHTHHDENNPFIREWGVFAIRNLCENNDENKRVISQLRIQGEIFPFSSTKRLKAVIGVADSNILEKAGLKVELAENGKPKLVRKE